MPPTIVSRWTVRTIRWLVSMPRQPQQPPMPAASARRALISLGSNLGDRAGMLAKARQRLQALPQTNILNISRELDNPPLLHEEQPAFLNQVVELETSLAPEELLERLKEIERDLGRISRFRYGPREIDLDILIYGDLSLSLPHLTLPHPALGSRPFLALLLKDLDKDLDTGSLQGSLQGEQLF